MKELVTAGGMATGTGSDGEEVLGRWANLGRQSTYFMAFIIGFRDLSSDLHVRMANWIQGKSTRKLGLSPRDHLKTSVWTIADSVRILTTDPLCRILIKNEVDKNASDFLGRIGKVAENCTLWRLLYPERVPRMDERWNSEELLFPRPEDFVEATVTAMGVGSASTSKHFTVIKEDDAIGKEASESDPVMQKAINDHKLSEHLLVRPTDQIQTYGTHWPALGEYDLYTWMLRYEKGLDCFITGCYGVNEKGEPRDWNDPLGLPIWPERFDREALESQRLKNGDVMFSHQMVNLPIALSERRFNVRDLRRYRMFYRPTPGANFPVLQRSRAGEEIWLDLDEGNGDHRSYPLSACSIWQVVDPGLSPESQHARTASVVWACTPHTPCDFVALELNAKAVTPKGCIDMAHDDWQRWSPLVCGVETVAGQKAFFYWIPTVYPDMGICELKTDTHTKKVSRIMPLGAFAQQGRVYVRDDQGDFLSEWETFPNGRTVDLLDASAYCICQLACPPDSVDPEDFGEEAEDGDGAQDGRNLITGY